MIDVDLLLSQHRYHIDALIEIVSASNEPLEGNVFFQDQNKNIRSDRLWHGFHSKRTKLASIDKTRVLEIGFNCGFSALTMLIANPNTHIVSLDICQHSYTEPCFKYLASKFGRRIDLIKGDSQNTLPFLLKQDNNFDFYLVDGGHSESVARSDLSNITNYANTNSLVLVDDTDNLTIKNLIYNFKTLLPIEIDTNQILCKINKNTTQEYAPSGSH